MSYIFGEHPFEKFLKLQAARQRAQKSKGGGGKTEKEKSRGRDEMKWNSLIVNDIFKHFSATSFKETVVFLLQSRVFTFSNVKCSGNTARLQLILVMP